MFAKRALRHRRALQHSFAKTCEHFLQETAASESILVLDSTGPSATKHYLLLSVLGRQRLCDFKEVHAFSGGAFAYCGFMAASEGLLAKPWHDYFQHFDADFRACHHKSLLPPYAAIKSLLTKKGAPFSRRALEDVLSLIFAESFLQRPLRHLPASFIPYVAQRGHDQPRRAHEVMGDDTSVRSLLLAASRVPFLYGMERDELFYDAAFSRAYRQCLKDIYASPSPCLVSTPWRSGKKGQVTFINCFGDVNQKRTMMLDFSRLMLNIPNFSYNYDLQVAFANYSESQRP